MFSAFTNATLIDEAFADELLRVKNLIPAISAEGVEECTDSRRGVGTYQKIMKAMEILKRKKLPFGISACYTSANAYDVGSEAYFDQMIQWGAKSTDYEAQESAGEYSAKCEQAAQAWAAVAAAGSRVLLQGQDTRA